MHVLICKPACVPLTPAPAPSLARLQAGGLAGSSRAHGITTVQAVELERQGDLVVAEIQASGFLYGMVRLLIGQLVAVGEGRLSLADFQRRWRTQARSEVKEAAPPQGLCLLRVGYPEPLFPKAAWYASQPRYLLGSSEFPGS